MTNATVVGMNRVPAVSCDAGREQTTSCRGKAQCLKAIAQSPTKQHFPRERISRVPAAKSLLQGSLICPEKHLSKLQCHLRVTTCWNPWSLRRAGPGNSGMSTPNLFHAWYVSQVLSNGGSIRRSRFRNPEPCQRASSLGKIPAGLDVGLFLCSSPWCAAWCRRGSGQRSAASLAACLCAGLAAGEFLLAEQIRPENSLFLIQLRMGISALPRRVVNREPLRNS